MYQGVRLLCLIFIFNGVSPRILTNAGTGLLLGQRSTVTAVDLPRAKANALEAESD